LRILSASSILV